LFVVPTSIFLKKDVSEVLMFVIHVLRRSEVEKLSRRSEAEKLSEAAKLQVLKKLWRLRF
jgi:hypothetical protein